MWRYFIELNKYEEDNIVEGLLDKQLELTCDYEGAMWFTKPDQAIRYIEHFTNYKKENGDYKIIGIYYRKA